MFRRHQTQMRLRRPICCSSNKQRGAAAVSGFIHPYSPVDPHTLPSAVYGGPIVPADMCAPLLTNKTEKTCNMLKMP